jgi:hypothetical protein
MVRPLSVARLRLRFVSTRRSALLSSRALACRVFTFRLLHGARGRDLAPCPYRRCRTRETSSDRSHRRKRQQDKGWRERVRIEHTSRLATASAVLKTVRATRPVRSHQAQHFLIRRCGPSRIGCSNRRNLTGVPAGPSASSMSAIQPRRHRLRHYRKRRPFVSGRFGGARVVLGNVSCYFAGIP